jgi:hypothetical protein
VTRGHRPAGVMSPKERRAALHRDPAHVAWLERAHAARVEQDLPEFIEDDEALDFIADALLSVTPQRDGTDPKAGPE